MMIRGLDQFEFHHTLAETGGVSLVYFTAPACGACRQLRAMFEHSLEVFSGINLFEVDAQRESALTHEFNLFHLPAMFLFREGEFHSELQAEPLPHAILAAVAAALEQPPMEAP